MKNLDYGIIGNCKSAALVSRHGSLDWCCLPEFNASSIFAKLLDPEKGGSFEILVSPDYEICQKYIDRTNVLLTSFEDGNNVFEVIDFMPRYQIKEGKYYAPPDIIRYVRYVSGTPIFKVVYQPKLEYAEYETKTVAETNYIKSYTTEGVYDSLYLYTELDKNAVLNGDEIELTEDAYFLISYNQKVMPQSTGRAYFDMELTKVYWLRWSADTKKFPHYNQTILRSALTLKLLSFEKTGAVIAALTTSLPETLGEVRNWDYRFCWLRDASMVTRVMSRLGHLGQTLRYINFILDIIPDKDENIQIMYGINGERKLTERSLDHLSGYENSFPVRVGNAAYHQKQNDIYGVLMDVIYQEIQLIDLSLEESESMWTITRSIVRHVQENWQEADHGIWELRTQKKHFTFSKVLCWVAIDRGVKIARVVKREDYAIEWEKSREEIRADILANAWNSKVGAFTQAYGEEDLDAANLLLEPYGFIDALDPKYVSTVKATQKGLSKNGLLYRYKSNDDFGEPKSAFTICTFWFISALFKIGEEEEAKRLFDETLKYSNHLGLFSEDLDFQTKRLLGNFPQAYSHLALIETAVNISNGKRASD